MSVTNRSWQKVVVCVLLGSLMACSTPQPILRSNKQLHFYGKETAQQEIKVCQRKVETMGLQAGDQRSANMGSGAILGVTLGGAMGASAGVWAGLAGVAIGAAAGSAIGLIVGVAGGHFKPLEPSSEYADAITKCLKEKGYEVSGWE